MFNTDMSHGSARLWLCLLLLGTTGSAAADDILSEYDSCLLKKLQSAPQTTTVAEIRQQCLPTPETTAQATESDTPVDEIHYGAMARRVIRERTREFDPFVIIPHRRNYILPVYYTDRINTDSYEHVEDWSQNLSDFESKFQLSLKVPLNTERLFFDHDSLYFAFTIEAWWQVYSNKISKPFRETNYQPELFYLMPLSFHPFGGNSGLAVGIEHQSNGRSGPVSRSWNRVYTNWLYEKGNFALAFRPWWRLPESADKYPGDPTGDDNPDIQDYMGHFDLTAAYSWDDYEFNLIARQNFATHKGGIELGLSFPLWGRLRGYGTFFNGYGDSLIDYNHSQTRFGLGLALTNLLD